MRKFAGRERQLCAKLYKKYGEAPDLLPGGGTSDQDALSKRADSVIYTNVAYQRDFKPYPLSEVSNSPLDFRSKHFDALKVFQTPRKLLTLPAPTAYPLDNIQKCRHLLPKSDINRQILTARPKKASLSAAEAKVVAIKKTSASAAPSLFEQLADTYLDGPFCVLRRCFLERLRVLVVIRRINSVRGTSSGFLKAFDKHMNLVLLDVTQEYIPLDTRKRLLREVQKGKRRAGDQVFSAANLQRNRRVLDGAGGVRREYVKQLFIRGDNVVSISAIVDNLSQHSSISNKERTFKT